ncbi:MAG: hypothetical protein M1142_06235 [Patescibacteria group bacterium]|nr:hypothetical protein [Patescibacteria group bacterium]
MEGILFQTSLIAAFVAGMVALFAPCCITFLLPAYLANVFKEKEKVLLMTLVFGAGIFIVLLPAVLGVSFISQLLFRYHNPVYIIGALVMLLVSLATFLGIKLPMLRFSGNSTNKTDIFSIFILGIVSGVTSACCAPVLVGILTLTFLSPNYFGALAIGATYVLGMVTPLLLISVFLSGKMPAASKLRKELATLSLFGRKYHIITSNLIAALIFFITGWITLALTLSGRLTMGNDDGFTKTIQNVGNFVNGYVGSNFLLNILFALGVVYFFYRISKRI